MTRIRDYDLALPILRACLKDEPVLIPLSPEDPRHTLSSVCLEWAEVIVDEEEFWDAYEFRPAFFANSHVALATFQSLIVLSGRRRLKFHFPSTIPGCDDKIFTGCPLEYRVFGKGNLSIVQQIISPHSSRIRELNCMLVGIEARRFLLEIPSNRFESLEFLSVSFVNSRIQPVGFTNDELSRFKVLEPAKCIGKLTCGLFMDFRFSDLQVPLRRLTTLNLGSTPISYMDFVTISASTRRRLVQASFYILFSVKTLGLEHLYPDVIEFPVLESLQIRTVNAGIYCLDLPDHLHLPVIRTLLVQRAERILPFDWNIRRYTSLIFDSSRLLRHLSFSVFPYQGQHVVQLHRGVCRGEPNYQVLEELFKATPSLETLFLPVGIHVHSETLRKIGLGQLLPKLTSLTLATNSEPGLIFNMLRQRKTPFPSTSSPPAAFSLGPSIISYASIVLPSENQVVKNELGAEAKALRLDKGCHLHFVHICSFCNRHCQFVG